MLTIELVENSIEKKLCSGKKRIAAGNIVQSRIDLGRREKCRVQQIAAKAIQQGRLERQVCEICGDERTHAHHDDYSKPLSVRWLCPRHHQLFHIELRKVTVIDN